MPRPPRSSRLRRGAPATEALTSSSDLAPVPAKIGKVTIIPSDDEEEDDIYGISDRDVERPESASAPLARIPSERSTRSRASLGSNSTAGALIPAHTSRELLISRLGDLTNDAVDSSDAPELGRKNLGMESSLLGRKDLAVDSSLLAGARDNLSGLEIGDSEIFGNLDSSFDAAGDGKETTGSHSGTRSADTSTFNVSLFRRQPSGRRRQSSIVGKDDAPIRPSSRGPTTPGVGSTLNLGNFRRRQRQPSILLSSAQKANLGLQRSRAASVETENAVAVESDMEESFLPEAEGTPVRLSRGEKSASGEEEVEVDDALKADGGREARSKKRKSTESHESEAAKRQAVEAETEETIHRSVEIEQPSSPLSVHDSQEEPSSPPSFIMRSIERRRATQELDSDILAPPEESDSREGSPTMWPSLKDLGKKRSGTRARKATPERDDDDMSELSEPPSLTHSPNFKATKPAAKPKPKASPKLSTADLEALLPRRRRKSRRGPFDAENMEDSESEEEAPRRRAAKKKPTQPLNGSTKANQANTAKTAPAPAKRATKRTYGSRRFDKENTVEGDTIEASAPLDDTAFEADVTGDTTTTTSTGGLPAELKAASRKFKEVDKWELEFEEIVEPSSDLPEGR